MPVVLLATVPTEAVLDGLLPAARRLGHRVRLLTSVPAQWPRLPDGVDLQGCDVTEPRAVLDVLAQGHRPAAVLTNSDHLQVPAALVAHYLGLPGKDWRACLRAKDKGLMRRALADAGLDTVWARTLHPDGALPDDLPLPVVVKPRCGVASEDVWLAVTLEEVAARVREVACRRPGVPVLVEEYLDGPLHTLETLGDGERLNVLGGFRTTLGAPPSFVEERLDWCPRLPGDLQQQVLSQLADLSVGFGACHTEFVVVGDRARLVEVNYRLIGDSCEFLLADVLGQPLFEQLLRLHLGESLPRVQPVVPEATGHARVDYPCADRDGILVAAPERLDLDGPARLTYRPLRQIGERRALTGTNRDYLGVVRAIGRDRATVDEAVERFLAEHVWEVAA